MSSKSLDYVRKIAKIRYLRINIDFESITFQHDNQLETSCIKINSIYRLYKKYTVIGLNSGIKNEPIFGRNSEIDQVLL